MSDSARGRRLLVVEDRAPLRRLMRRALEDEGYAVVAAGTVGEAREALSGEEPFHLVITDLRLPDGDGLDVLRAREQREPPPPAVVLTAFGSVQTAVEAMKLGAVDFLEKPLELDELSALVAAHVLPAPDGAADSDATASGAAAQIPCFQPPGDAPAIVGNHPRLRAALRLLERVAPTESTVLLTGESGTGKELFARALHALSRRAAGPFVAVNCAAIPEALVENELFGHEKGAFTGASRRSVGRFEQATGGTLLLDEIGELGLDVQAKVLRVLEERVFERVGGSRQVAADARIVAATNRDLHAASREGGFRRDLLYRLDIFPIELPALAERRADIPALTRHLVERLAPKVGTTVPHIEPEALARLETADWPGNVRQLANLLERALILGDGGALDHTTIDRLLAPGAAGSASKQSVEADEVDALRRALRECDGDKRRAAETLGISYRTLQRRVRRHDLEGYPRYRD